VKDQQKKKRRLLTLITVLLITTFITSRTFKEVNLKDISIFGSEFLSNDDIVANSSLDFPIPLIFVKTTYIEKELKNNLSLQNVAVFRQIFPFSLKILIKTRTPIARGETIIKGEKINGFVDKNGYFINEKYLDKDILKKLSTKVFGWKENYKETLSKIFNSQINNDIEFVSINFSPNGFLILEDKILKTILLGFNSKLIETQLQIINDMKDQLKGQIILEKIDSIDLTDPNNPKIKVFKP